MDALLSHELRAHLKSDYNDTSGDAILPPRKKKHKAALLGGVGGAVAAAVASTVPVRISTRQDRRNKKSRERKLVTLVVNKEKKDQRSEHYATLAAHSLTRSQQELLAKSGSLGATLSAKASLSLQLKRQRAGLEAVDKYLAPSAGTKNSTLLRATGGEAEEEEGDDDDEEGEEEGDEEEEEEEE